METIINNPQGEGSSGGSSGMGVVVGVLLAVVIAILLYMYAWPMLRGNQAAPVNDDDSAKINIEFPVGGTPGPAPAPAAPGPAAPAPAPSGMDY